jgi:hypothetical protein
VAHGTKFAPVKNLLGASVLNQTDYGRLGRNEVYTGFCLVETPWKADTSEHLDGSIIKVTVRK